MVVIKPPRRRTLFLELAIPDTKAGELNTIEGCYVSSAFLFLVYTAASIRQSSIRRRRAMDV